MSGLRIIGGDFRGRKLKTPEGLGTRPLPDRVRQSLFDWLGQRLDDKIVADCFAGSGSFSLEAVSRGALEAYAIEADAKAAAVLTGNAQALGCDDRLSVITATAPEALDQLPLCDVVFCDPPFPWFSDHRDALAATVIAGGRKLVPGGWLLVRGERGQDLPPLKGLLEIERRAYGRSWIAHFAKR